MKVNGDINFTGNLTLQGRDIKSVLDSHYELGLVLIRGLIGGGYVGSSVWNTLTLLSYATDAWATSASILSFTTNYGGWASAHTFGYVFQGSTTTVNKVMFANETVSSTAARTNGSYSPSMIQQGVGFETTGVPYGRYAYTCGNSSTSYDKLDFLEIASALTMKTFYTKNREVERIVKETNYNTVMMQIYMKQVVKTDNDNILYVSWANLYKDDPKNLISILHSFTNIPKENFSIEIISQWRTLTMKSIQKYIELCP